MKNRLTLIIICSTAFIFLTAFKFPSITTKTAATNVYTLYRSSVLVDNMRIHAATFDVDAKEDCNCENCNIAAKLFQNQPGVAAKYW